MGRVYRAVQHPLGRVVAVKVLLPRDIPVDDASARFLREARATAQLTHPNTVTVHDFGSTPEGWTYLVTECLEGRTLQSDIESKGPLDLQWVARVVEQIAGSLAEAHAKGMIHRDLKPANVFLARIAGRDDVVKVLDFGLAKAFAPDTSLPDITADDVVVGTAGYLAPEQIHRETLDHRTDIWALGVLLYQALTGRLPFTGRKAEVLHRTLERKPPPPSRIRGDLPEALDGVVLWALEKDAEQRPASVVELSRALSTAADVPFSLDEAHVGTVPAQPAIVISRPPDEGDRDATQQDLPGPASEADAATVQAIPSGRSLPRLQVSAVVGATAPTVPSPPSAPAQQVAPAQPSTPSAVAVPGGPPGPPSGAGEEGAGSNRRLVGVVVVVALASAAAAGIIAWLGVWLLG